METALLESLEAELYQTLAPLSKVIEYNKGAQIVA